MSVGTVRSSRMPSSTCTPPNYGLAQKAGLGGITLAVVGVVPIAAGLFNFCLFGPLFGVTLMGRPSK